MIDEKINRLLSLFERRLWAGNNCEFNGRVYDNDKGGKLSPETFVKGREYSEKLLNDKKDVVSFIRLLPNISQEKESIAQIYFSVNLSKLYPNDLGRPDLKVLSDVYNVLVFSEFKQTGVVTGVEAFKDYGWIRPTYNMHPFFIFRVDTLVNIDFGACETIQETQYNLTLSAGVGGTIQPEAGTSTHNRNEIVPINAIPENGYRFVKWSIGMFEDFKNLTYLTVNNNIIGNAIFESIGFFREKIKSLHTAPVNRGNWYFGDYSGNDNDVRVKMQKLSFFTGQNVYIDTLLTLPATSFSFCTDILVTSTKETDVLGASTSTQILLGNVGSGVPTFYLATAPSATTLNGSRQNKINNFVRTVYIFDKEAEKIKIINQFESIEASTVGKTFAPNALTMRVSGRGGARTLNGFFGELVRYDRVLTNAEALGYVNNRAYFNNKRQHLIGTHGQGATIYDISGNNKHGTVVGAVLSKFWGSTSDEAEPYEHTIGATLYSNTSNNSIMPICGDNNYTISGFTRIGFFAPGSGALKGLPNTYSLVGNAEIPAGDYTADQIAAFVNSDLVEVTQNDNAVTQLILKEQL